jgi:hypothetical protein
MHPKPNTITWISRTTQQITVADVESVLLLHPRGEREAQRLTITFAMGFSRYRMELVRDEYRRFNGICKRFEDGGEKLLDSKPVSCILLDSGEEAALTLSHSPWVDDNQDESDWMGNFDGVRRVIHKASEAVPDYEDES